MAPPPPGASPALPHPDALPSTPPTKEKLTKVPLWMPISAFVGTSLILAIPLLMLRGRGVARRSLIKDAPAPPPRSALASARMPPPSAEASASASGAGSEPVVTSLREEIETPSAGEMMSALSRMNKESGMMAAKAFGIATALVLAGGAGLAWTVRETMGVTNVREFGHRMRYHMWKAAPDLTARIHRAPESDEERRQLAALAGHSELTLGAEDEAEWSWDKAQGRLEAAYKDGGFPLWAEMAVREVEAEARVERAKREKEFRKATPEAR